jgi:hypothetical protein
MEICFSSRRDIHLAEVKTISKDSPEGLAYSTQGDDMALSFSNE